MFLQKQSTTRSLTFAGLKWKFNKLDVFYILCNCKQHFFFDHETIFEIVKEISENSSQEPKFWRFLLSKLPKMMPTHIEKGLCLFPFYFACTSSYVTFKRRFETKNRAVKQAKLLNAKWRKSKRREVTKAEFITLTRGLVSINFSNEKSKMFIII